MNYKHFNNCKKNTFKRLFLLVSSALLVILISCSQKYDETGIFDPQDPNFYSVTLATITSKDTIVNSIDIVQSDFLYLGTDIAGSNTTAYGEILFNFELFNTDLTLDEAYITIPVFDNDGLDKIFDVWQVNNPWNIDNIDRNALGLTLYPNSYYSFSVDSTALKINLDIDSLKSWFTEDSINTKFNGFLIRSRPSNEITPIIKLYSSRWDYDTYRPKIHRFITDSVLAHDGETDSTFIVETTNNLSIDLSLVNKESYCLDDGTKFKIGGFSGEGVVYRIELPDSIPTNATVLSSRIEFVNSVDDVDTIYGSFYDDDDDNHDQIAIYKMTDSLWYNDLSQLNYDILNYRLDTRKLNLTGADSNYHIIMDGVIQEWITDPESNYGFYITSIDCWQPFGYMVFDSLKIKISYITIDTE